MELRFGRFVAPAIAAMLLAACSGSNGVTPSAGSLAPTTHRFFESSPLSKAARPMDAAGYGVIYSFPKASGGPVLPVGPLAAGATGDFYGTSFASWASQCGECGDATVFHLIPGSPAKVEVIADLGASNPVSGVIRGPGGAIYGTTEYGGNGYCGDIGCGDVFRLTQTSNGWKQTILHSFTASDGAGPSGPLLQIGSSLFGVATIGGGGNCPQGWGCGVVYKVNTDGTGFTILHHFSPSEGYWPLGSLALNPTNGRIFGTALDGGTGSCDSSLGCGTVWRINQDGTGFTVLYNFTGYANNNDAAQPESGITFANGNIFGTTASGGKNRCAIQGNNAAGCGAVFELTPNGAGGWAESVLHDFAPTNDGQDRIPSGLSGPDANGILYGTTSYGDSCANSNYPHGCGTVFSVNTSTGAFGSVHQFGGPPDGAFPWGSTPAGSTAVTLGYGGAAAGVSSAGSALGFDAAGNLWGSTAGGGSGACQGGGCGTIYSLNTGSGTIYLKHHR